MIQNNNQWFSNNPVEILVGAKPYPTATPPASSPTSNWLKDATKSISKAVKHSATQVIQEQPQVTTAGSKNMVFLALGIAAIVGATVLIKRKMKK